jgi:hypothetical protein
MAEANLAVNNGVNVEALIAAREALTNAPQAAQFKWRAACEWKNGTYSHSTVEGFFGLGEEQRRKTTFKFDADHPRCSPPRTEVRRRSNMSWLGWRAA